MNNGLAICQMTLLEPVAREQEGNMEINSTSGFLNDIINLNKELKLEEKKRLVVEVVRDIISSIVETATDSSSHEEDTAQVSSSPEDDNKVPDDVQAGRPSYTPGEQADEDHELNTEENDDNDFQPERRVQER